MPQIEPKTLQGFSDYLPEQMKLRQYVGNVWRSIFEKYGYGQLETPVLEHADVLLGKYGEEERLIYHFNDHGGRHVAMRYDQTVPLARVIAQHYDKIKFPFKRYEINRVWRAEAARRGRKREFHQCDIDIVGTKDLLADAEILFVLHEGFSQFSLPKHVIYLSHRKILEAYLQFLNLDKKFHVEVNRSVDKLDKVGMRGVEDELKTRGIPADFIAPILDFISFEGTDSEVVQYLGNKLMSSKEGSQAVSELTQLLGLLDMYSVPKENVKIKPSLVRGLDYYTGSVFEIVIPEFGSSSFAGGGRYDNLCGMFTDHDISGVGVGIGFERICLLLEERKIQIPYERGTKVLVSIFNEELLKNSLDVVRKIREKGISAEVYLDSKDSLKKQFQYADRLNIPHIVIIGPDEVSADVVVLKVMKTREQTKMSVDELIKFLAD